MNPNNKIEYDELNKMLNRINNLTAEVQNIFSKVDEMILENVASGKGVWDGNDATNFKNEWNSLREDIPKIVEIFRKQKENIENTIKISSME